jgi:transposase
MKAYSQDLRERIVKAVEQGKSRREASRVFKVSLSTVKRYLKQSLEEGNLRPKPIPGRPANKEAALAARLRLQLEARPDATLVEHCQEWEAREGMKVSTSTMSRALLRLRFTRKKNTRSK